MNNTKAQASELINELKPLVKDAECDVVICVPYTVIETAAKLTAGTNIKVGAENIAWADKGAFTGEVSAAMLKEVGAEYVVIGHSERRQYFGETDETVNKRTVQALKEGFKPIVCVGETLDERESGETEKVCKRRHFGGGRRKDGRSVRTRMGYRHRQDGDERAGAGDDKLYTRRFEIALRSRNGGEDPYSVRRQHESRQCQGAYGATRYRRRSHRRGKPQSA